MLSRFPLQIQKFGDLFVYMQRLRHIADYDPDPEPEGDFTRTRAMQLIAETSSTITDFQGADVMDRRAFSAFVLFRLRRD